MKTPASVIESSSSTVSNPTNLDLLIRHVNLFITKERTILSIQKKSKERFQRKIACSLWRVLSIRRMTKAQALAEIDLTRKHIKAWKEFICSDADHLVVLESDALIVSNEKFLNFLESLNEFENEDYISLTWPVSNELLSLNQIASNRNKTYYTLDWQITNTTAGYVLSKNLAAKLLRKSEKGKVERKIAIDFYMNQIFAELRKKENWNARTIVPSQELVLNGSLVGEYVSGIQE
jgi:hypothetical protein